MIMAGLSNAKTDANYNGVEKAQEAANNTIHLTKKQKRKQRKKDKNKAAKANQEVGDIRLDNTPSKGNIDLQLDHGTSKPGPTPQKPVVSTEASPDVEPAYSEASGKAQDVKSTPEEAAAQTKKKNSEGLFGQMKADASATSDFFGDTANILSGKAEDAAKALGIEDMKGKTAGELKYNALKKRAGEYLSDMGGGSKFYGGAKVGAYMAGGAMLLDMLNPFDND